MNRILFPLFFVVVAAWCSPGFAAQSIAAGPGTTPLDANGVLNGVELTGPGITGTLSVGAQDVDTSNTGLSATPPAIWTDTASQGNITFGSTSTVFGDIGKSGVVMRNITAGASGSTDNFLGSVYATELDIATGTVNFKSGTGTNTVTKTVFTDNGTLGLAANTTLTSAVTTTAGDNTGTLSLASASQLTGAIGAGAAGLKSINVVGGSNTAGVSAGITGAVNTHGFSLGTNELDITGALTIATNGVINTTLAAPLVYGRIVVAAGNASNLGTGLAVDVTVPATTLIVVGNQFNIVQSTSGTSALATVVSDPANPLYTFSIVTMPAGQAAIKSTFVPLQAAIVNPPSLPITPIAVPVATVLAAITNPSSNLTPVLTAINALTDPAAVVNAEVQLSPLTPAVVAPLVTFQGAREFENLWLSHLDMCDQFSHFYKDDPSCRENNSNSGWWAKAFGYFGNQEDRGAFPGYNSTIAGTMIAYDVPLNPDTRAGLGLGYARSIINGRGFDTEVNFDTYQATAYIGHDQGPWFVDGSASLGWNQYTGRRDIQYPGVSRVAKAGYFGQDYTAYVNSGYHFSAPKQFTITPLVSLQYSRVNIDAYRETGAGDIDLHVKPQGYDYLESGLGGKVERGFSYHNWTFVPELHFKWLHDFYNPTLTQTSQFISAGSTSSTTPGLKMYANTYNGGTGITLLSCECSKRKWSLDTIYDYYWRNDGYKANQATLRLTVAF